MQIIIGTSSGNNTPTSDISIWPFVSTMQLDVIFGGVALAIVCRLGQLWLVSYHIRLFPSHGEFLFFLLDSTSRVPVFLHPFVLILLPSLLLLSLPPRWCWSCIHLRPSPPHHRWTRGSAAGPSEAAGQCCPRCIIQCSGRIICSNWFLVTDQTSRAPLDPLLLDIINPTVININQDTDCCVCFCV